MNTQEMLAKKKSPQKKVFKTAIQGLEHVYWCSSPTKQWADKAKKKYLEISDKYNTPNQTKRVI
jgi:hypothetical protein